ncbi:MAG: zinc ribbon domain-containing protein [Candidatus Cloacimonetes bacterium]|nr:zinc ribbon domain-containing protein [Candidatus Cloacimonadota bacterium]
MSLIICSECGNKISSKADFCPHCGKKKKKTNGCLIVLIIFISISLLIGVIDNLPKSSSKSKIQVSRKQFDKNIEIYYDNINTALQNKNYEYALTELKLFKHFNMIDYKNIKELYVNTLKLKVSKIPYSNFQANINIYKELVFFEPENNRFKKKLDYYQNQLNILNKKKQKEENRKNLIAKHFSSWDGSHNGLTKYIKNSMHDPSSYKHVETFYGDYDNYLVIETKFRGKNAFGGIVTNSIKAKVDLNGNVIEVLSQYP